MGRREGKDHCRDGDGAAGGASSLDAVRGEYNAIATLPGFSYENLGHYGWHGMADGSDEILYAADRDLIGEDDVLEVLEAKPERLELVMTGSHERPDYLESRADLVTNVRKERHPIDTGQRARRGTEF